MDEITDSRLAESTLGTYLQPGIGQAYPELRQQLLAFYREQVVRLPFLPAGWWDAVAALAARWPDAVVSMQPAYNSTGGAVRDLPPWLAGNTARMDAWQAAANSARAVTTAYLSGEIEKGREEMAKADAKAAFWNEGAGATLIHVAEAIRDIPGSAAAAAGDVAASVTGSFLRRAWWVLALVVIGLVVWYGRGTLGRAAARKITGAA